MFRTRVRRRLRSVAAVSAATVLAALGVTATGSSATALASVAATPASGTFVTLQTPVRKLDTRTMGTRAPYAARSTHTVTRASGVPTSGVAALVVNLTAVTPSANGYLTAYPGGSRPTVSSLNYLRSQNRANLVTVPVAPDGSFTIYTYARTHVLVDVIGWYYTATSSAAAGPTYYPLETGPLRAADTLTDLGEPLPANSIFDVYVALVDPADHPYVRGFAASITAVKPSTKGYLTVWDGTGTSPPSTSTMNFYGGRDTTAFTTVRASRNVTTTHPDVPMFSVYNSNNASMRLLVDVFGIYFQDANGLRFAPVTPTRVLDTRNGTGLSGAFGAGQTRTVTVPGAGPDTFALATNTTIVRPSAATFVTAWGGDLTSPRPGVRTGSGNPGDTAATATMTETMSLDAAGTTFGLKAWNAAGTSDVLIDVMGRFDFDDSLATARTADTHHDAARSMGELRR